MVGSVGIAAGVFGLVLSPASARASEPPNAATNANEDIAFAKRLSSAFKAVARNVEPSVVHITSLRKQLIQRNMFDPGEVRTAPNGLGSGVIVGTDGTIVTNNHVVKDAEQLRVRLWDGKEFDAVLVGRDQATDLAVIRISQTETGASQTFQAAKFGDSETLDVGEWVVAIGSPFGLSNTVTAGIVSAKGRTGVGPVDPRARTYQDFIQTDAAINPGNSGGPLVNLQGEVVGINSAIATRSGAYDGVGFSIPQAIVKPVLDNIVKNGKVVRGWLGVGLSEASAEEMGAVGGVGVGASGVMVKAVEPESPAAKAGIVDGDIIVSFDGKPVNEQRLRNNIAISEPGTRAVLSVARDGKTRDITVTLGDLAQATATARGNVYVRPLGAMVRSYSALTRQQQQMVLGIRVGSRGKMPSDMAGATILDIEPDSPFVSNLQAGDLVVAVDGKDVATAEDFAKALERINLREGVRLNIIRNGERGWVDLKQ